jgi:hypothetical protein
MPGGEHIAGRPDDFYFEPTGILSFLPAEPQMEFGSPANGTLEFMAPCITLLASWKWSARPTKLSKRAKLIRVAEADHGFKCCFIRFDTEDQDFSELILLQHTGSIYALCTKTEAGVSRRVGVAAWTSVKTMWKNLLSSGTFHIEWRHIRLR